MLAIVVFLGGGGQLCLAFVFKNVSIKVIANFTLSFVLITTIPSKFLEIRVLVHAKDRSTEEDPRH